MSVFIQPAPCHHPPSLSSCVNTSTDCCGRIPSSCLNGPFTAFMYLFSTQRRQGLSVLKTGRGREASSSVSYLLPPPPPHFCLPPCGCCLFLSESSEASLSSVKCQAPTLLGLARCKSAGLTVSTFCRGARGHTAQPSIQAQSCLIYAGLYFDGTPQRSAAVTYADCGV